MISNDENLDAKIAEKRQKATYTMLHINKTILGKKINQGTKIRVHNAQYNMHELWIPQKKTLTKIEHDRNEVLKENSGKNQI